MITLQCFRFLFIKAAPKSYFTRCLCVVIIFFQYKFMYICILYLFLSFFLFVLYVFIDFTKFVLLLFVQVLALRKKCPYSELFWSAFSNIQDEYGEILRFSPYSVRMRENADQNNSEYRHFLRSWVLCAFALTLKETSNSYLYNSKNTNDKYISLTGTDLCNSTPPLNFFLIFQKMCKKINKKLYFLYIMGF